MSPLNPAPTMVAPAACAEALVNAGLARVVTAIEDPDPRVSGGGHAILKAAGITVETGICAEKARA